MHVTAKTDLLRTRMLERAAQRHAVHWDREARATSSRRAADAGEWAAVPLDGGLVEVDTTTWPDLDELTARVVATAAGLVARLVPPGCPARG